MNATQMRCAAGEPIVFSYQDATKAGLARSMSGRAFVAAVYGPGRVEHGYFDGTIGSDENGAMVYWALRGDVSERLYSTTGLKVEVSERFDDGRGRIFVSALTIEESAPRIEDYNAGPMARFITRIVRKNDPDTEDKPEFSASIVAYNPTPSTPAPAWTVQPSITGTATVGQTLTGIDGTISNGSVTGRQWLRNGSAISGATNSTYTLVGADAGTQVSFRVTATGTGGTSTATTSAVTVAAAPATPAPAFTTAPSISPTSGATGTTFTATDGQASNAVSYTRRWLLSGSAIGTGTTVTPSSTGSLVLEVTATGAGGSTIANSTAVTVSAAGPVNNPYLSAAQRLRAAYNSPRTVAMASSPPTVDLTNTGNSTINPARSMPLGGETQSTAVPNGNSGPLDSGSANFWIVTKPPGFTWDRDYVGQGMGYAPGNSKRFIYDGRKFDMKVTTTSSKTFSVWYSEDEANGWKAWKKANEDSFIMPAPTQWALVDFGTAAKRAIEVIGEDELQQIYGFNFETGRTVSAFPDTMPKGMMFGDSYVYGQGASQYSLTRNGQQATKAMTRKTAEYLGTLNVYNDGLRTNGFAQNRGGAQAYFHERIDMAGTTANGLPRGEGSHWGALDWVVIPSTINDDGVTLSLVQENTRLAFQKMRAAQPTALILFPIGGACPTGDTNNGNNSPRGDTSATNTARKNGFKAVFGSTPEEWIANGAYLLDGTETGENWVPSGSIGSSPYFPGLAPNADGQTADYAHPNAAGHAFFASKYAAGLIALADAVIARGGTVPNSLLTETGDRLTLEDGSSLLLLN